ncbi:hypothetical protein DL93DRAFT_458641 [Clavulina sp. PMI_390]|nr:hypothetical protein DL93DRAFT_458641 [Clavulina sp. PMI_390]
MNAFLLYAKKRRPQISTNHPTMRTGEISKVLSKEWQNMPKSDKQYYQDRAKKLKDSFNLRWPDYVYKRRPNNSRKKRRGIPSTDSPTIEEGGQRDGDGGEGDAYGEGSGGDDATASPNLSLRLPHERDEARMGGPGGLPGYSAQPAPADHRANPLPPNGAPMGGPRMPYPPNGPQAGGYGGYDDQPPYGANGGTPYTTGYYPPMPNAPSQPPPRNNPPSVWNHQGGHDPNRSPYDTPRSASTTTGYSPVTDGDQQWGAGRPSAGPSPINTSWQNPMHGQPPAGPLSATARPGGPRSSADNSPIQPPGDAFRGPRPPPTPQSAGPRPFANLNAPMYGGPGGPGLPRTDSPTSYNAGYGYAGGPAPNGVSSTSY